MLALIATASPEVAEDIVRQLQLEDVAVVNTGFYRKNLRYEPEAVQDDSDRKRLLVDILRETEGTGIVYTRIIKPPSAWASTRPIFASSSTTRCLGHSTPITRSQAAPDAPARWVLLYQRADQRTHIFFMAGCYPRFNDIATVYATLARLAGPSHPATLAVIQAEACGVASKTRVILSLLNESGSSGSIVSLCSRLSRGAPAATAIGTSSSG